MDNKVDFYAVSFVKDAQVVHELKNYLQSKIPNIVILCPQNIFDYHVFASCLQIIVFPFDIAGSGADIHVIVKIESADSIPNLHSIITASDGVIS